MKLKLGRSGIREGTALTALTVFVSVVFCADSASLYGDGNLSYAVLPAAVALALGGFIVICCAMRKHGCSDVSELFEKLAGKAGRAVCFAFGEAGIFVTAAGIAKRFAELLHSFVFRSDEYIFLVLWIFAAALAIALFGFECVNRIGLLIAVFMGAVIVLEICCGLNEAAVYRLFPMPLDRLDTMALTASEYVGYAFAPLMCMSVTAPSFQGTGNLKKEGIVGAVTALIAVASIQTVLSLGMVYEELADMQFPLYRLNMTIVSKSYWLRLDKLNLFVWLLGGTVAIACFVYCGAYMFTRQSGGRDIRPAMTSAAVLLLAALYFIHVNETALVKTLDWIRRVSFVPTALFTAVGIAGMLIPAGKGAAIEKG